MWDVKACRSCLVTTGRLETLGAAQKRMYIAVTGLELKEGDSYPVYFCGECRVQVRKSLAFRRKARRAEFVLKEIMSVRQQVTFSDISKVNRVRTNLLSSVSIWDPLKCQFSTNKVTVESNEDTSDINDIHPYQPKVNESLTCQIIEIASTDYILDLKEEPECQNGSDEKIDSNLDMEDIFKDLKEEVESDGSEHAEEIFNKPMEPTVKKKPTKKKDELADVDQCFKFFPKTCYTRCANMLDKFTIRQLDVEGQLTVFQERKETEPFKSALLKCAMCIASFKTMDDLINHVKTHNTLHGCHVCMICRRSYNEKKNLIRHTKETHAFQYTCNVCNEVLNTLRDAYDHSKAAHNDTGKIDNDAVIKEQFEKTQLSDEQMHETVLHFSGTDGGPKCVPCNRGFRSHVDLNNHLKNHEEPSDKSKCKKCDICSVWRLCGHKNEFSSIKRHIEFWHKYKYTCKTCGEVKWNRQSAIGHYKTHDPSKTKRHEVVIHDIIQFSYLQKKYGDIPIALDADDTLDGDDKPFKYLATNRGLVLLHEGRVFFKFKSRQNGRKNYRCSNNNSLGCTGGVSIQQGEVQYKTQHSPRCLPYSSKWAVYKKLYEKRGDSSEVTADLGNEQFRIVLGKDKNKKTRVHNCDICGHSASRLASLYNHQFMEHGFISICSDAVINDESYCKQCSVQFQDKKAYLHHCFYLYHKDGDDLSNACRYCRKIFDTESEYIEHKATGCRQNHKGPATCRYCEEVLPNATFLKTHHNTHHKDLEYYNQEISLCEHCGKSIHEPEHPYQCKQCSAAFSLHEKLRNHCEVEHKVSMPPEKKLRKGKKIYVYPHMQIDASQIPRDLLKNVDIDLLDYLENVTENVKDYRNYMITDPLPDPRTVGNNVTMRKRKPTVGQPKKEMKKQRTEMEALGDRLQANLDSDLKLDREVNYEEPLILETALDNPDTIDDTDTALDTENIFDIEIRDGEQYVTIDGVTYKIEENE